MFGIPVTTDMKTMDCTCTDHIIMEHLQEYQKMLWFWKLVKWIEVLKEMRYKIVKQTKYISANHLLQISKIVFECYCYNTWNWLSRTRTSPKLLLAWKLSKVPVEASLCCWQSGCVSWQITGSSSFTNQWSEQSKYYELVGQ